jgi:ubiquinone/menaquinone biosynthesis C-methylase UbiE
MSTQAAPTSPEYVLGTGQDELDRLAFQHRLWSDAAHAAWRKARLTIGHRVLDVGCGPGFASFDLAQLVGRSGRVVGVDESPGFISHLRSQAVSRGLPQLMALVGDVQALGALFPDPSEAASFDVAYARWLLCFVADPAAVLRGVATLLKPGGRIVIHDYFNYRAMTLAPRRQSYDRAVAATIASWEARGGDADICARLPRLLEAAGLELASLEVHQRIARGADTMFEWTHTWWKNYAPKLVTMGLLSAADCAELLADLAAATHNQLDFIVCPPVFELIAVKR